MYKKTKFFKGISGNSPLNNLQHYHVSNPGLAPCIAHDLFEGVVAFDMWLAINYFVKTRNWFKIHLLNFRLNNIKMFGETQTFIPAIDLSKPSKQKRQKLTGSANQIRRLLIIFSLAVCDIVEDFSNKVWKMILVLREICSIICASTISNSQIIFMKELIEDYITL